MPWTDTDKDELIRRLTDECDRAARYIRYFENNPAQLRAWAHRIETKFAPGSHNLAAMQLEACARAGHEYLTETTP
jgi:hypothetical protein